MLEISPLFIAEPRVLPTQGDQDFHPRHAARDDMALWIAMLPRLSSQTRRYCCLTFRTVSLAEAWGEAERITRDQRRDQIAVVAIAPRPTLLNDVTILDVQWRPSRDCDGAGPFSPTLAVLATGTD
jgi:hypothetical protein